MHYSAFLCLLASVAGHSIDTSSAAKQRLSSARDLCKREVTCVLNAEASEGPFYITSPLVRSSIVEDRAGALLDLEIQVIDVRSCEPVNNVWVDIWHADADGVYSGWATGKSLEPFSSLPQDQYDSSSFDFNGLQAQGELKKRGIPVDDTRFLRGVQRSVKGFVNFKTIVPGWYRGRADHIHVRVHSSNSSVVDGHLLGGTVSHTGQLYFANDFVHQLEANVAPYNARTLEPKKNEYDHQYVEARGYEQIVQISQSSHGNYLGQVVVGIDPSAVQPPGKGPGFGDGPHRGPHHRHPEDGDQHLVLLNVILAVFVVIVLLSGLMLWRSLRNSNNQEYQVIAPE